MSGVVIVFASIAIGSMRGTVDPLAGIALMVVGSVAGIIAAWIELS